MRRARCDEPICQVAPFRLQLLKWIGNKQRFAHEIASYFPAEFDTYYETFLGSAAVLGALAPRSAVGSDCYAPLMEIWQTLQEHPAQLKEWYSDRWHAFTQGEKNDEYERIKASYK